MTDQTPLSVAFAEQTTLPQLQLLDKKGVVQCSAYVNAFAVTRQEAWYARPNGNGKSRSQARGLWYLSLVGEPGTGTTLQALYGGATENSAAHSLSLDGIGAVVLGNHREDLVKQGYATHWNYSQQPLTVQPPALPMSPISLLTSEEPEPAQSEPARPRPIRGIHGILEPRQLTVADPLRAMLTAPRRRAKKRKGERAAKHKEEAFLSTGRVESSDPETRKQAADLPCFLLLIPGHRAHEAQFRPHLFLSFLGRRLPWPLKSEWAEPLWEACLSAGMVEQLDVWSYGLPFPGRRAAMATLPEGSAPVLVDGYLCTPQPAFLAQVVERLIAPRNLHQRPQVGTLRPAA